MQSRPRTFTKARTDAPCGFFATEAAGLRWLRDAHGARIVDVVTVRDTSLELERLAPTPPQRRLAVEFGRALALTHRSGAAEFGALPPGASDYFFGPLQSPLRLPHAKSSTFGRFYADGRVAPVAQWCRDRGAIDWSLSDAIARVCTDLRDGRWDRTSAGDLAAPARIHGDLWSGNLMWTADGVVLIDPAACGGHPEADLAMLALFGAPYLDAIVDGYHESSPLPEDWIHRVGLHQLFPLLVHALLFGGSYAASVREVVDSLIE